MVFRIGKKKCIKMAKCLAGMLFIDLFFCCLFQLPPVGERLRAAHGVGDDGGVLD